MSTVAELPHVVILGGGFGGLKAARALRRAPVRITLVDRRNHHLFQPLLYQVAAAALSPADIAVPIRSVVRRQRNVRVLLAEAQSVDPTRKQVVFTDGEALDYDFLIVATGATHSYFGHPEWESSAPGLKTIEDALEIRRRVLMAFEAAERESDPERQRAWLTFVIIGAGPTGVELAGAIAEIARQSLVSEFRNIDPRCARVILLEGLPRVLPAYPPKLSEKARRELEDLGVDVRNEARVTSVDRDWVLLGTERIATHTVLWAAGVEASPIARSLGVPLDKAGRVLVAPDLSIPGHPEVLVIGDLAHYDEDGKMVPGVAPAALQEGRHVAKNIVRTLCGQPRAPFHYVDKGSFATVGRNRAVGTIGSRIPLWGFLAWVAWIVVHIFYLIGFRNRLLVMFHWAYLYFTFKRGSRLITGDGAVPLHGASEAQEGAREEGRPDH
ncbi:MAG: NAD(P)/FAD-dependent oxidoreductase [Deltaproteobacteria bacterium]|nr:NAD(P)/FAD-dependent oxidoreductase [Deltaproteobacteria bacterium]